MIFNRDGSVKTLSFEEFMKLTERLINAYDTACQASRKYRDKTDPAYRMAWSGFYDLKREVRDAISNIRFNRLKITNDED